MDHRLIGLLALGGCVENGTSNRTWLSSVCVMMVAVGRRQRLNEWADQRDIAGPPMPRWLVWLTATWPGTIGLAVLIGAWGFVRTAIGSGGWGFGDDIAGL